MTERFLPVADAYNAWAEAYDSYPNPMLAALSRILPGWAALADGARVVEFGCGTGRNLAFLAEHGAASVAGFDLSEGMLDRARDRLPAGSTLRRHDMTLPVPIESASADLVLFCLTLEHVAQLGPPLAEAARLLAPAGRVAIAEIHPELAAGGVAAHFEDSTGVVRMPTHAHRSEDWHAAFGAADLVVEREQTWLARDVAPQGDRKVWKRGPDAPIAIEFVLRAA